jgi:hypothetical protein
VIGLITNNDETAYREEVRDLAVWCQDNYLSLNVIKTKWMIVEYRKSRAEHLPILIDGALTGCITAWYGNCLASDRKALEGSASLGPSFLSSRTSIPECVRRRP